MISPRSLHSRCSLKPSHRPFAVSGDALEYLVGITPEIVAHGNQRGVNVGDTHTPAKGTKLQEEHHLEEHAALQFHEAVIENGLGEVRL